ncbi:chemotaxis protein CheW [Thermodesulfobacterium sp. TA1]|uniref:chemotaxis protein CheW n=1 Tax=Thermodesulfobacterium sp. TA1 TaxID=2234087 RepID=UPI001232BCBA|nr:chemotaxis protein CheW [Thermodesulfobacterium sp. TA1]QER42071.1 chemotaxis protein CheW [Thermodesulfobacterium sp. TA1]
MDIVKKEDEKVLLSKEKDQKLAVKETITFVTFYLGNFLCGIPAELIMEINKDTEITPVPLADDYILGIMNLRGQIVTVMDLAKRVNLKEQIKPTINLIIKNEGEAPVSFVVERIGDILEVPFDKVEKPPEKVEGISKEYIKNVYQLPDKILLIFDVDKLL